ncbi:hypothetical protein KM043_005390 [Ampulex compressa]|nr:hypothetical protein KM043_005390 [Ampulex compressa]
MDVPSNRSTVVSRNSSGHRSCVYSVYFMFDQHRRLNPLRTRAFTLLSRQCVRCTIKNQQDEEDCLQVFVQQNHILEGHIERIGPRNEDTRSRVRNQVCRGLTGCRRWALEFVQEVGGVINKIHSPKARRDGAGWGWRFRNAAAALAGKARIKRNALFLLYARCSHATGRHGTGLLTTADGGRNLPSCALREPTGRAQFYGQQPMLFPPSYEVFRASSPRRHG